MMANRLRPASIGIICLGKIVFIIYNVIGLIIAFLRKMMYPTGIRPRAYLTFLITAMF
jgi:hypothetical protein